jgi:surface protein
MPITNYAMTDSSIRDAVALYFSSFDTYANTYGDISTWDVSGCTNLNTLFFDKHTFNGDVSKWNVSNVTYMNSLFNGCYNFNRDLSAWDMGKVTDMYCMFQFCNSFTSDLSKWNVSNCFEFGYCFKHCYIFNSDLSRWNISKPDAASRLVSMFVNCDRFNADLSKWDVRKITAMPDNFCTGRPTLLTFALQPVWGTWPLLPASLSALVFNSNVLSLSPTFLTGSLDYTATFVASAVLPYTVTLTPTAYSASSTITVNGNSVTSGSPINLVFGIGSINTITIVLVNGSNTCTYIVTFPSLLSKSMTALSAYNTTNSASTQRFQMNLDNTSLTSPIMQSFQDISQNALGYTSNAVNQRFIFGSALLSNPLELNSTVNAAGTEISSNVKANNFLAYSDVRLKKNIEGLSETQGIDNIRVVQYNNKSDDSKHFGVIAHELAEIYPELVHSDENNVQSVSYVELIPICIHEIQQLKKYIVLLKSKLDRSRDSTN